MSKTKFLGIPEGGKRAGWIEMEGGSAGVGGGVQVVTITQDDGTFASSHTGAQIAEMARKGAVIAELMQSGVSVATAVFGGVFAGTAVFFVVYPETGMLNIFKIADDNTSVTPGSNA